VTPFTINLYQ